MQIMLLAFKKFSKIRRFLSFQSAEILIHSFITVKLDYCNSLFYGLLEYFIYRLQSIQNSAARLITFTNECDHITPILKQLHSLPVNQRIKFLHFFFSFFWRIKFLGICF